MKFLVTGGAGFIGSNLVEALVQKGNEVIILDNFHTGAMENLERVKEKIEIIRESVNNLERIKIGKVDGIFHLGIPSSSPMYKENPYLVGEAINGAIAVYEFARKENAKVVFASSSSVYNGIEPPHREDAEVKVTDYYTEARIGIERLGELYNKLYGIKVIGIRFFSVYGPHEKAKGKYANVVSQFLWGMQKGEAPIIYGDGKQARDFVYVRDAVRACELAMEKDFEFEIFNAGTGRKTTFNEIVAALNSALGKNIKPKYVENPIKNYVAVTLADTTKAKRMLGFEAEVSLEEGIKLLLKELS